MEFCTSPTDLYTTLYLKYGMEEGKVKLRYSKATDVKSIIELQAQLDRPLSKDRTKPKNFKNSSKIISSLILLKATEVSF